MANNSQAQDLHGWDKVVAWYGRHAYAVQMVYSLGASVVIIGALFKILHWPGASYVLMAGMFTESFLFFIGIFEKPHVTYHWENVYPQLLGEEPAAAKTPAMQATQEPVVALKDDELKALRENMSGLAKAAGQLTELSGIATAGNKLTAELTAAGKAVNEFAGTQTGLAQAAQGLNATYQDANTHMAKVVADTKEYGKSVEETKTQAAALYANCEQQLKNINVAYEQHIKSINTAYELQLKHLQAQAKAYETIVADTTKLQQHVAEGAKAGEAYATGAQKLASQIADLNKVYGNMLNALA